MWLTTIGVLIESQMIRAGLFDHMQIDQFNSNNNAEPYLLHVYVNIVYVIANFLCKVLRVFCRKRFNITAEMEALLASGLCLVYLLCYTIKCAQLTNVWM